MSSKRFRIDQHDPLSIITCGRNRQFEICDEMERIADQLGGPIDVQQCSSVFNSLRQELPLYHRDEEALFNLLAERKADGKVVAKWNELAASEHSAIESYAFELAEPLGSIIAGNALDNVEAAGYLLRCCFEITRHHLRWEDVTLLDGWQYAVQGADMVVLQASLVRNRRNLPGCGLHIAD